MTNAINYLYRAIAAGVGYIERCLPSPVDIMIEMPSFGANEWKVHFGLDVESPEIPQHILSALEEPCPNWPRKKKKETHLLCLAPAISTLEKLNHSPDLKEDLDDYKATSPKPGPYWFLMTKEIIPGTKYSFELQKKLLSPQGYDAPYLTEVAVASFAAQLMGKFKIFHGEGNHTLCYETSDELFNSGHIAVGSDSHFEVTICSHGSFTNGIAGVIR
jgi:hypothetical protein